MERLTNSIDFCQMHCDFGRAGGCFFKDKTHCYDNNIYNRLREYEIAEEQGLLLRLPCKVGSTVYTVKYYFDCKFDYNCPLGYAEGKNNCDKGLSCEHEYKKFFVGEKIFDASMTDDIGKTVFLTKEEAEQALKQMGE